MVDMEPVFRTLHGNMAYFTHTIDVGNMAFKYLFQYFMLMIIKRCGPGYDQLR